MSGKKPMPIVFSTNNVKCLTVDQIKTLIMILQAELIRRITQQERNEPGGHT